MIRITVYAGTAPDDDGGPYEAATSVRTVDERDVSETLRQLGLEWKQADYFPTRQTVITLDPVHDATHAPDVKALVREAATLLERTELL